MVHEPKKHFYKRFLYEPFPVESSLPGQVRAAAWGQQGYTYNNHKQQTTLANPR
jgi:hypothetical protein